MSLARPGAGRDGAPGLLLRAVHAGAVAAALLALPASADEPATRGTAVHADAATGSVEPVPGGHEEDDGEARAIVISLEQAVELALLNNFTVDRSQLSERIADAGIGGARGAWDPVLNLFFYHARDVEPRGSTLDAPVSLGITDLYEASLTQLLPHGARYELEVNATRSETNNPFFSLTPAYSTDVLLRFTQPLLEGLGENASRRAVRQAINSAAIARADFRVQARDVVKDTIDAYWELVFAREDLEVREAALDLALRLERQNRIMVEVGTLAPLEITQSEAAVAQRRLDIIVARAGIGNAADALRRLIGVETGSPWWNAPIVPADEPRFRAAWVDLDEALAMALVRREELASAELAVENARLDLAFAKDLLQPTLDFEITLGSSGLAGRETMLVDVDGDTVPETVVVVGDEDVHESFDQILDRDFNSWSASLLFSHPLGNRAAKAEYTTSRLGLEQRLIDVIEARQTITLEVRQAVRDIQSAQERIQAAAASAELQRATLDAEVRKFEEGLSTNFQVLQFQTDLASAESAELRALIDYLKALAALEEARGTLLDETDLALARSP